MKALVTAQVDPACRVTVRATEAQAASTRVQRGDGPRAAGHFDLTQELAPECPPPGEGAQPRVLRTRESHGPALAAA